MAKPDKRREWHTAKKLIREFEKAVRLHEMKGAQPPEESEQITLEYELSKEKLRGFILKLVNEPKLKDHL